MGVADNKTYKDQYHFKDDFRIIGDDYPSINDNKKINSTIKENPYRSNVEIEGGEVVVKPDLTALFKAQGKKHSGGGMDVLLAPDSFVFSNFKDIKITDNDKEMFELKKGGSTPAQVLKANIKVKHYNTLISNLDDPYKDDLAKKSSSMMLEKYIMTLGNIAYLQEEKKRFPDGLPDFSIGTAPISDFNLETKRDENKQYAKMGGPILQRGGTNRRPPGAATYDPATGLWYRTDKKPAPQTTGSVPAGYQSPYTPPMPKGYGTDPLLVAKINKYNAINESSYPTDRKGLLQSRTEFANGYPELVEYMFKNQGMKIPNSLAGKNKSQYTREDLQQAFIDPNFQKEGEALWGNRFGTHEIKEFTSQKDFDQFIKGKKIASSGMDEEGNVSTVYDDPNAPGQFYTPLLNLQQEQQPDVPNDYSYEPPAAAAPPIDNVPTVNPVTGQPQQGLRADWKFTPWQRVSQGFNWLNYAGIQRHMPARAQYNATYADPALVNEQQAVGNARGIAGNQIAALNTLNPIMRNAQAQGITGELLNAIPGLGLQAETTNAGIKNQFRQLNMQTKNNESMVNMANNQNYYREAVEGRKNFSNARTFAANNAMNNVLRDVETNQKLAYNLLTLNNPAYGYDWQTGNFTRNPKNILDSQGDTKSDFYTQLAGKLMAKMDKGEKLTTEEVGFLKALSIGKIPFSPQGPAKKGGKIKNPYKY